jgi:hypothetical protein
MARSQLSFWVEEVHVIEIERPSWWRSSTPPSNWSNSAVRRHGLVRLPEHLCWSGPVSEFNLDDPAELRVVYDTVLHEGSDDDVRTWIHPGTLLNLWDLLWVPPAVHEAWDGWIAAHRVHAAV